MRRWTLFGVGLACCSVTSCRIGPLAPTAALKIAPAPGAPPAVAVDPSTLDRKLMFGYQGWFGCPEDGSPLHAWEHWFRRRVPASATTLNVDMWPDVSELGPEERCPTPLTLPDGRRAELYSAYNPATVQRHFRWMEEYDLPGVFLQRFTGSLGNPANLGFRYAVARNVRAAAQSHARVL